MRNTLFPSCQLFFRKRDVIIDSFFNYLAKKVCFWVETRFMIHWIAHSLMARAERDRGCSRPAVLLPLLNYVCLLITIQGSSYWLGQRFCACFMLRFALQGRGGGKGGSANFKTKHTEPKKSLQPSTGTLGWAPGQQRYFLNIISGLYPIYDWLWPSCLLPAQSYPFAVINLFDYTNIELVWDTHWPK